MHDKKPNVNASSGIIIKAPIEKIWQILAVEFGDIGNWASGVDASEGSGTPINGSTCSERACKINATGFSDTKERITVYDKEGYILKYTLFHGLPGFVKDAYNTWQLLPKDESLTLVKATTEMRATGIMGAMMNGFMTRSTQKVLKAMCQELKYFVEHGEPHPTKRKAIEKYNRKKK
ncbi:SRPBCC family protein [uncultured Aquimarina sp.]|uniref:SRPBCC family protein n=1 Tax=uncultured Aquimarina sp. TaxID=575652 RepID=UPI002628F4F7|nr:SRPBCC family protein [uncultured Aquimarina sp.]